VGRDPISCFHISSQNVNYVHKPSLSRPIVGSDNSCDLVSCFFSWGCFALSRPITLVAATFLTNNEQSLRQCKPEKEKETIQAAKNHSVVFPH